jgi:hypothetical protein
MMRAVRRVVFGEGGEHTVILVEPEEEWSVGEESAVEGVHDLR